MCCGRGGLVGECKTLAEARRERPTETALVRLWNELDCEQIPDRPTEIFRVMPRRGDDAELLEREGVKVPRYVLQQECDRHQQTLIRNECLTQLFDDDGTFEKEIVDWDLCATKLKRPPRFRWEQLRCEELVAVSPLAEWAIRSVREAKAAETERRRGKSDNEVALEEAAARLAAEEADWVRRKVMLDELEAIKAEARAVADTARDFKPDDFLVVTDDGPEEDPPWLPEGEMFKGFETEL